LRYKEDVDASGPKALRDPAKVAERRVRWESAPALATLRDYVGDLSIRSRCAPAFDADDAGTEARVLFVLEAPGPKVLKYAIRHRLIAYDPAQGVALPRVTHAQTFQPDFLSAQEVEALVAKLSGAYPHDLFVELAAYTGLRAGEMLGLQVRDVNLLRRTLRVERTLQWVNGGWHEDTPKSEKSLRTVPLRRALVERLTEYLAQHPWRDDPTAALWPGRNYAGGGEWRSGLDYSKRMDYASFYRNRFAPAAAAIGHPGLRFHDLRHTAASLFAASGMPLARVSRILGHADTTITYKVYLGFFPDDF